MLQSLLKNSGSRFGRYGLLLILAAFILLGSLYDFNVPFFEKPDELKHFAVIQYIQTHRGLPLVRAGEYQPWDQEGTQPPLYYLLAAVAVAGLDLSQFAELPRNPHYADERSFLWRQRGNNNLYLHAPGEAWSSSPVFLAARMARWLSLLTGVGTISLTYFLARLVFDDDELANWRMSESVSAALSPYPRVALLSLFAAALTAFVPQFLHTSTAISNDGLSVTMAAATLLLLAVVIKNGGSRRYALYLGLVLGLSALTKLSLLYLLPLTGLVLLFDLTRHRSLGRFLADSLIIGSIMVLLAGWWFWRNWQIYGDLTALNAHLLYRGGPLNPPPTLADLWQTELTGLELSFWAAFGAGQILFEPWLYEILRWVKYAVGLGLIIGIWRSVRYHTPRPIPAIILTLLALWSLMIFIALLCWMQITPASWGRLLYPALPALSILATWSLSQFTIHHSKFIILRLTIPLLLALALLVLALISPFYYLRAAYAKTPLLPESAISGENLERVDFTYDGVLRLIGYRVEKTPLQPGDSLPVTLYWQATQPTTKNYSIFVHVLGRDNNMIGQANTYPQGGNWPTRMLEVGQVLKDTYYVPIRPEAEAPAVIRLGLGIFEFEDPARTAKPVVNQAGAKVDALVGAIPLLPPAWPELKPARPSKANFAGQIRLIGYDWIHPEARPGTRVPITFYWETLAAPGQNLTLFIHLVDSATQAQVAGFDSPPNFPTLFWQAGYRLADSRRLALPADLPPGDYQLRIGWYNPETLTRLPLADGSGDAILAPTLTVKP